MQDAGLRIDIAVHVVDNFGDAGVAWRLARQLAHEHGAMVTLWIDAPHVLARFVPGAAEGASAAGVRVRKLTGDTLPDPLPQVLVEAFGGGVPNAWPDAIETAPAPPVWINVEYLSAEDWVDRAHGLPSPHPVRRILRWFFVPGFTRCTGGLLRERDLFARRDAFLCAPAPRAQPWREAGLPAPPDDALAVALFCYPSPALAGLFAAWSRAARRIAVLVPEGVAVDAVTAFAGRPLAAGTMHAADALTLAVAPFVDQDAFDRRLWASDFALVRGEDSFVRAQWAARPFAWHVYPQDDAAHGAKLDAFLARYAAGLAPAAAGALAGFTHAFVGGDGQAMPARWDALHAQLPRLAAHAREWAGSLATLPDLATQLVDFARSKL